MRSILFPILACAAAAGAAAPGIAVVELFTSEGCSSCPPADRLLSALADEAARDGKPVYTLSFHVDYWNDLGWADPFSRPEYTRRQQDYAQALGGGVYTPEMIVNGSAAFVGSREGTARKEVRGALGRPAVGVKLEASIDGGSVNVTYAAPGRAPGTVLRLALVEPDRSVPVVRGENEGRTLKHHHVVRAFATAPLSGQGHGSARVGIPAGVPTESLRLIGYVQDPGTGAITGAAETGLSAAPPPAGG